MENISILLRAILSKWFPVFFTKVLYKHFVGRTLNLANPTAFTEKIQWLKLYRYSNNDLIRKCIDKYRVREFVADHHCEEILNELIGVWDDVSQIEWETLPDKFVLKCNHGCSYNIICKDKTTFDREAAINLLNKWMKEEYGLRYAETVYYGIKPIIICEQFIETSDGSELKDYKIFCSYGVPKLAYVITGGHGSKECLDYYTVDWKWIPVNNGTLPNAGDIVPIPNRWNDMLEYAKKLSKDFPIVRVDLYFVSGKILFGELTFLPTAGLSKYKPEKYDYEFGKMFDISKELTM